LRQSVHTHSFALMYMKSVQRRKSRASIYWKSQHYCDRKALSTVVI